MSEWAQVDHYFQKNLIPNDSILETILKTNRETGLPQIDVSPMQGKQLEMLVRLHRSQKILEIGTLGAYSSVCMARALPEGGKLTTLEIDPKHAEVARKNIAQAGLSKKVEVLVGPAIETLPKLQGPYDFFFIDADKKSNPEYFQWSLKLARVGSLIIIDNVVRGGKVLEESNPDENIKGVRRLIEMVGREKRVDSTAIQTVGDKGYDGYLMALVIK